MSGAGGGVDGDVEIKTRCLSFLCPANSSKSYAVYLLWGSVSL